MLRDVRFGLRMLAKSPGFTVVAVLALALGIGANSAIFSVVNGILFRPLPYPDADRLVVLLQTNPQRNWPGGPVTPGDFAAWQERQHVFTGIAATRRLAFHLTGGEEPERLRAARVSESFFRVLGVGPAAGRTFSAQEFTPGNDKVVVIGHALWSRRFGSDPQLLGQAIRLNGDTYVVVGIMPPGFEGPGEHEIWAPLPLTPQDRANHTDYQLAVYGRLRPGVTAGRAESDMQGLARQVAQEHPTTNSGFSAAVRDLRDEIVGPFKQALLVLFGAVGLVLLIACANVANLLLARASARSKEMAIRAALGAGHWRIVRQLLAESVALGLLGGAAGLALAFGLLKGVARMNLSDIPRSQEIGMDGRALLFTLLLSVATGILFGLAPALSAVRVNLSAVLKQGGRAGAGGGDRLRAILVITEIMLAVALLTCAGLLLKSFARLSAVSPGFVAENVLLIETALPRNKYKEVPRQEIFYRELTEKLAGIPGVLTAAGATTVPFGTADLLYTYALVGQPRNSAAESPAAFYYGVTPGYFRALGIPLRQGRLFTARDGASGPPVAIVNETLSRKHWPGQNPIGKYVVVDHNDPAPREIVGVIGDVKRFGLDVEAKEEIYEPFRQHPERFLTLVLKTGGAPGGTARAAARMAHESEPDIPLYNVRTMEQQISTSVLQRKIAMSLLAVFACLALALAALGTYGVLSFAVSQRTREIGVRIALGALPSDIVRLVLKRGLMLAGAGVASGIFVAWILGRLLENQLYQVGAADPVVYLTVVATIVLVALAACLAPARRAVRVDPVISLRYE